MRIVAHALMLALAALLWIPPMGTLAGQEETASDTRRAVVLDTSGFWRLHHTLRPPVIATPDGLKPILIRDWLDRETPLPPPDWHSVDFDDSTWLRGPARIVCRTPYLARVHLRGYFGVTDTDQVKGLTLSLGYHGGTVVRLNGREVGRVHLPEGELGAEALAEPYPEEAFVGEDGRLLVDWDLYKTKLTPERERRLGLRERILDKMPIPARFLRQGINVLSIEIIRSPYDRVVEEKKDDKPGRKGSVYNLSFNTCELMHVQLTADSAHGLVLNAARPQGMQVWNSDALATDFDLDFAGPSEPLHPIRIVGVRNGIFSGKVVVGSDTEICGLRAEVSDLQGPDGSIPSSAVRVRYGMPWGTEDGVWGRRYTYWDTNYSRYPRRPSVLGVLAEAPADVFPIASKRPDGASDLRTPGQPEPVFGAVVPVWVTVRVPEDAPAGDYAGRLTITAQNEEPITVSVELRVVDWALPAPEQWRTWAEVIQVPDTSAVEYGVPLWSEEHWRMIAHAMDLIGETCSRVLYVPLICYTNMGNAESMVRWVEKDDGQYDYDFSVLERYLETAQEHMGPPRMIVLQVWDTYMMREDRLRASSSHDQEKRSLRHLKDLEAELGGGPVVTMVDAQTGEATPLTLPALDAPESRDLWKPLFDGLLDLMRKRGLEDKLVLGLMSDAWPTRGEALFLKDLSGDLPWISHSHMGVAKWRLHDVADVAYQTTVTQNHYANDDPPMGSKHGWKRPELIAEYARGTCFVNCPASRMRHCGEFNITGTQRGIGRVGGDFWRAVKDRQGRRRGTVAARYPQSSWRNLDLYSTLLGPGPDGPASRLRTRPSGRGCPTIW